MLCFGLTGEEEENDQRRKKDGETVDGNDGKTTECSVMRSNKMESKVSNWKGNEGWERAQFNGQVGAPRRRGGANETNKSVQSEMNQISSSQSTMYYSTV